MVVTKGTKIHTEEKGIFTVAKVEEHFVFIEENYMIVDIVTLEEAPTLCGSLQFKSCLEPTWARTW